MDWHGEFGGSFASTLALLLFMASLQRQWGLAAVETALFSITGRETGLPYTDALRIRSIPSSVVGPVISPPWLRHLVYRWLRVLQIADA